jgi:4-amino-4-deoxy-L-arabinose transferase-like glycosyltransferase
VYFHGLDSQHIPKNGDEYPYEHITRVTAASGRLLPLRSELPELRNTKPPLLFWQGIASTGWGRSWTLWDLRWPSVVYTLLTALLVFLLGYRLSSRPETGFRAALSFLAFFSTYRYGRPFLTNPPEVFWLFLPVSAALCWQPRTLRSRFAWPVLMGIALGIALLYKSFALALPVGLALAWWHLHLSGYRLAAFLGKDAGKVLVTASIALAVFATWLLLDPDPRAIWSDFVLRENLGKFELPGGYLARLLWGGSSLWSLAFGYPLNAGLLVVPVALLFFTAWRRRRELDGDETLLWIWVLTLFVVFSLPSQRSSRYLLAGMPALAILLALNWQRIGRWAFALSLATAAVVVLAMAALSIRLQHAMPTVRLYPPTYWVLLTGTEMVVLLALAVPRLTRTGANVGALLTFLSFSGFLRPFDGPLGSYDATVQRHVQGRDVWVPSDFVAKEERYRFLLPGAHVHAYREERGEGALHAVGHYPMYVVQGPLTGSAAESDTILGQRLDLRGRQSPSEIWEILRGNVFPHLSVRELLIEARATSPQATPPDAVNLR